MKKNVLCLLIAGLWMSAGSLSAADPSMGSGPFGRWPFPPPPPNPPSAVVTVAATQPNASEVGPTNGVFTVTRVGATNADLAVYYFLGGTARNGRDYQMLPGFLTIPAGASNATVTVVPLADFDLIPETNETVVLQLQPGWRWSSPGYALGTPSNATVTIAEGPNPATNPVPVVTVTATKPNASEAGPTNGVFTINRAGDTNSALTVYYALGGGARNGQDYQLLANSVTIAAGTSNATVTVVPILDYDSTAETNETVILQLMPMGWRLLPTYTLGVPSNAVVTIAESPNAPTNPPPVVSIFAPDPVAYINPTLGVTNSATFVVYRTGNTNAGLAVRYVIGGSASNGVDYVTLSTSVTIPAGQTSAAITVTPLVNTNRQTSVTVILTLQPAVAVNNTPPAYTLGRRQQAAAVIAGNALPGFGGHRISGGGFHVDLQASNGLWQMEMSTNLVNWTAVCTNLVTQGAFQFVDPDATNRPTTFYRVRPAP